MKIAQLVRTTNDVNGNPRRLWAVYDITETSNNLGVLPVKVIDEGYEGRPAETRAYPCLTAVHVTPAEFRVWRTMMDPRT